MRDVYNEQLRMLHQNMTEMGAQCETAVSLAVQAVTLGSEELAARVFEVDAGIDKMERDIESLCLKLLLKQQPVASDLRDISSALKMISDLERIGDQASDIADLYRRHLRRQYEGRVLPRPADGGQVSGTHRRPRHQHCRVGGVLHSRQAFQGRRVSGRGAELIFSEKRPAVI